MRLMSIENDTLQEQNLLGITILDFYAEWCGPCKRLTPVLEALATENRGRINIIKVNVDKNPQLCARYHILSMPTLILLKDGQPMEKITGVKSGVVLQAWIEKYLT